VCDQVIAGVGGCEWVLGVVEGRGVKGTDTSSPDTGGTPMSRSCARRRRRRRRPDLDDGVGWPSSGMSSSWNSGRWSVPASMMVLYDVIDEMVMERRRPCTLALAFVFVFGRFSRKARNGQSSFYFGHLVHLGMVCSMMLCWRRHCACFTAIGALNGRSMMHRAAAPCHRQTRFRHQANSLDRVRPQPKPGVMVIVPSVRLLLSNWHSQHVQRVTCC
jgi:hypothetical protein